jgi:hypothetical protein
MDNLEKLIRNNIDEISSDSPPEGHLERFEMKLSGKNNRRSTYWIGFLSGIAAVLVIGLIFFIDRGKQDNSPVTLSNVSEQYAEVEFFYTREIGYQTQKLNEIANKLGSDNPTSELIKKELEEYDIEFQQISSELKASPNDERVISAMIGYYQTKLEIINKILNELEKKQLKSKNHENTNI